MINGFVNDPIGYAMLIMIQLRWQTTDFDCADELNRFLVLFVLSRLG